MWFRKEHRFVDNKITELICALCGVQHFHYITSVYILHMCSIFWYLCFGLLTFFSLCFVIAPLFVCNVDSRWCAAFCHICSMHQMYRVYVFIWDEHTLYLSIEISLSSCCLSYLPPNSTIICFSMRPDCFE